jgi:hypothetical protein
VRPCLSLRRASLLRRFAKSCLRHSSFVICHSLQPEPARRRGSLRTFVPPCLILTANRTRCLRSCNVSREHAACAARGRGQHAAGRGWQPMWQPIPRRQRMGWNWKMTPINSSAPGQLPVRTSHRKSRMALELAGPAGPG